MTWNIVSDSSCDLRTASFHSSCVRFETVPLRIQVGGREFVDENALSVAVNRLRAKLTDAPIRTVYGVGCLLVRLPLPRRLCRGL